MLALASANLQGGEQQPVAKPPGEPSYQSGGACYYPFIPLNGFFTLLIIGEIINCVLREYSPPLR
jgi:hypothetical protein